MRRRRQIGRGRIANEPRRLAPDVDMRSPAGKRFAYLFDLVANDFPGANPIRVRDIAFLKFELEKAQAAGNCSLEDVVRVNNLISRRERDLRATLKRKAETAPERQSLKQQLDADYGAAS
jgi:hypothetical protein